MKKINIRSRGFLFLVSLFFAVLVWVFVLTDSNPTRIKDIKNVTVEVQGIEELNEKGLLVSGKNRDTVTIRMEGTVNALSYVSEEWLTAYIDVSKIDSVGDHKLTVQVINTANSSATVRSVNSAEITVQIDEFMEKDVPIEVQFDQVVPEGYWFGNISLESELVHLTGGKERIGNISKAICNVSTSNVINSYEQSNAENYSASINLTFVDENDKSIEVDEVYSAIVTMPVANRKSVKVDLSDATKGSVGRGYKVNGVTGNLSTVDILGRGNALQDIESIRVVPVELKGEESTFNQETVFVSPKEGISLLGNGKITLTIEVGRE